MTISLQRGKLHLTSRQARAFYPSLQIARSFGGENNTRTFKVQSISYYRPSYLFPEAALEELGCGIGKLRLDSG